MRPTWFIYTESYRLYIDTLSQEKSSLVYRASSRTAKATERNPVSKIKTKQKGAVTCDL